MIKFRLAFLSFILGTFALSVQAQNPIFGDSSARKKPVFPLMKGMVEKAEEQGIEFPKPYGVAASIYYQNQKMEIEKISVGQIVIEDNTSLVNIKDSRITNTTLTTQARGDVWILPFMNVYGMVGKVTTFNDIRLKFNLDIPAIPGLTEGDFRTLERNELANVNGTVLAYGTVLAGGYGKLFVNVNLTWATTNLKEVNSSQRAFVALPMIGMQTKLANFFVGGMYQNIGNTNKGSFISASGEITQYNLEFVSNRWNFNLGFNKSIGNWSFNLIQGLGNRTNGVIELGYRFGN